MDLAPYSRPSASDHGEVQKLLTKPSKMKAPQADTCEKSFGHFGQYLICRYLVLAKRSLPFPGQYFTRSDISRNDHYQSPGNALCVVSCTCTVRVMGNTLLVVAVGHFLDNTLLVVLPNQEYEIPTTYTYFGEFLIRVCKNEGRNPFTNQKTL